MVWIDEIIIFQINNYEYYFYADKRSIQFSSKIINSTLNIFRIKKELQIHKTEI